MGIPPLPKNWNTACGKHKEDILSQLSKLAKSEHSLNFDHGKVKSLLHFHPWVPEPNIQPRNMDGMDAGFEHDAEPILLPGYELSLFSYLVCLIRFLLKFQMSTVVVEALFVKEFTSAISFF